MANHVDNERKKTLMDIFTHPVGDTHLYSSNPIREDGTSTGVAASAASWTSSAPDVASAEANTGVAEQLQGFVHFLAPGTATITVASTDSDGTPYSSVFQAVVPAPPVNPTVGFTFVELS